MQILVTGVTDSALVRGLKAQHSVRTVGDDLRDPEVAKAAIEDIEAIIHLLGLNPPSVPDEEALDFVLRGTYTLFKAAQEAGVRRIVVGSSLDLFAAYPRDYLVNEQWQPQPGTGIRDLCAYLTEASAREFAMTSSMKGIVLRMGAVVSTGSTPPAALTSIHVDDALAAFNRALEFDPPGAWSVYHIVGQDDPHIPLSAARKDPFEFQPQHPAPAGEQFERASAAQISSRPIKRVVVFGAGGPIPAEVARALRNRYTLRLTDVRSLAAAATKPQNPTAPVPDPAAPPHEEMQVDVTNYEQVLAACEGMDAIVNGTVVRPDPVMAWLVNTIGAYNVMRAAVAHNIRRVVHTGPELVRWSQGPWAYNSDFDIPSNAPSRAGTALYAHTKWLGQEIVRIFAEEHGLEAPAFYFNHLLTPDKEQAPNPDMGPFVVSWADAGRAIAAGVDVNELPEPYVQFLIRGNMPHGKLRSDEAQRILGWQPQDRLDHLWRRD